MLQEFFGLHTRLLCTKSGLCGIVKNWKLQIELKQWKLNLFSHHNESSFHNKCHHISIQFYSRGNSHSESFFRPLSINKFQLKNFFYFLFVFYVLWAGGAERIKFCCLVVLWTWGSWKLSHFVWKCLNENFRRFLCLRSEETLMSFHLVLELLYKCILESF